YQWILGIVMTVLLILSLIYSIRREKAIFADTEEYISTLSYRIKKTGEEAFLEMPIGIILFSEDYRVEWINGYMSSFFEETSIIGKSLIMISESLITAINENDSDVRISIDEYKFQAMIKKEAGILYLFDRTERAKIESLYKNERP